MSTYFKRGSAGAVIVALIAIILLGFAAWYLTASKVGDEGLNATSTPSNLLSYTNAQYGYTFSYPKDFTLAEKVEINELSAPAEGVAVTFPATLFTGTTISKTSSHVAVVTTSTASCSGLIPDIQNNETATNGSVVSNGRTYTTAHWDSAGAVHRYESDAAYITQNDTCYLLILTTDTLNPGNYEGTPEDIARKTAANQAARAELKLAFDQIVKSFVISPALSTMQIKVPLLVDGSNDRFQGPAAGCDKIVYMNRTVQFTTQPLNAVYKELFAKKESWPYTDTVPGNFLTSQPNLLFIKAEIQSGVAKVYLEGEVGPLGGICDDPRLKNVLTYAATQFPSVKSVEFYLNSKKVDFVYSEKGE